MEEQNEYQVDLKQIFLLMLRKLPVILVFTLALGLAAFIYSNFFATPIYSANVKFYVNNQQGVSDSTKVQRTDLDTARTLVNSYINMIYTDLVIDEVASASDLGYEPEQILSMTSVSDVDDEAPIFIVTVRNPVPEYAQVIANTFADVAPGLIQGVVKGSDAEIIDRAKLPERPVSPNVKKYTLLGLALGFILGAGLVLLLDFLDARVKSSDYLTQTFELPVLGVIPNIAAEQGKKPALGENGRRA